MPQGTLTVPLAVSIDEKIQNLITLTMQHVRVRFNQLLESATTRVEIIVTFLAVLELIKRGQLVAQQDRLFGEIILAQRNETRSVVESARADTDYTTDRENL